jgi:hypothetical protein
MLMRRLIIALLGATLLAPSAAQAARPAHEREYLAHYAQLRARHGVKAPGCNLITSRYHNRCHGKATKAKVIKSNAVLERMLYVPKPAPRLVRYAPRPAPVATSTPTYTQPTVHAPTITPRATSSSSGGGCGGGYRGLYQFDCQTWRSVGGSGDPAAASPAEQTKRAAILQSQRGTSPWPNCGSSSLSAIAQCESGGNPRAVG